MFESSVTALMVSNEEMNDIMNIVKTLEEPGLLMKELSKIIENEAKTK